MTAQVDEVTSDAFLKVETHGIEAIPDAERHGRPTELGFLWAGAFVNYASLFTASLLTTYYGLGVWDGLAATALGTLAAALILGLLSNTGPRSGQQFRGHHNVVHVARRDTQHPRSAKSVG